jgi:hypothetical protein
MSAELARMRVMNTARVVYSGGIYTIEIEAN